jgi:hypothetical protein
MVSVGGVALAAYIAHLGWFGPFVALPLALYCIYFFGRTTLEEKTPRPPYGVLERIVAIIQRALRRRVRGAESDDDTG